MEIINTTPALPVNKQEIIAEKQKEYTLLGNFSRTRSMSLWSYCPKTGTVTQLKPVNHGLVTIVPDPDGKLKAKESGITGHVNISSLDYVFEAVNKKSAEKRVCKFLSGKIATLNNFKPVGKPLHFTDFFDR